MNIMAQSPPEKVRIAGSFGRAAARYDRFARLQRDIGDRLLAPITGSAPAHILDLGSGTGYCAAKLAQRFPGARITSLDLAAGMLVQARQGGDPAREDWVCGDAEALPFADGCFDLVVSNLTLQWCPGPAAFFAELYRVMRPGALARVSTLAANTLAELKASWASVDDQVHVNSFLACREIAGALQGLPFAVADITHESLFYYYASLAALTAELKGIGAHNLNAGRPAGLTPKRKLKQLKTAFEAGAVPGKGIPVTYDMVLLHLAKQAP